ncbi:hypothetical protein VTO73DRAFT_13945 [Trametes versicolor]
MSSARVVPRWSLGLKIWSDAASACNLVHEDAGIDFVSACTVYQTRCAILGTASLFRHSRACTSSQSARRLCDWESALSACAHERGI